MIFRSFEAATVHLRDTWLVLQRRTEGRPMLIGVGGATASGKSMLSRRFRTVLEAAGATVFILEGDRFLIPAYRREHKAPFPEGVYEIERLKCALRTLYEGRTLWVPFYEKTRRATARVHGDAGLRQTVPAPVRLADAHRQRCAEPGSRIWVEKGTGDLLEEIEPGTDIWIFDSELALLYPEVRQYYEVSYGIYAPRGIRRRNFLNAVARGERYPVLTPAEAVERIEGFFETDDRIIEPTVEYADHRIILPGE